MTQKITPSDIKGHASWLSVVKCYLKCQKVMNSKLAALNLTAAQHELLMNINHKPGSSQQQISDRLLVVKSNTSALLKKLHNRGLIERKRNPEDGRNHQLYLTAKGEAKLAQSMQVQITVVQAMTAVLSDREIQANLELMTRVYDALHQID
ncbi:MarR family winged helix-turn-helix transcriptional regulator [Marinicella sp. S1101]|uniref:MarR family winged helix-turn-helix transcriptional regulator n=1 Tax=Marinicella marina TaxID=2996016 RepID=UPI002260901F|nr:MarR family winged helix-turn-helix transcriptional regulator [Marinicella marina]MCX7552547.1 MarR family winged helix-turn-helix transcriptional regulator [Marinicella marina]MDJ1139423.1 MarR family winged helix-turn-helix transcriptional regulator [Marinicella marina]